MIDQTGHLTGRVELLEFNPSSVYQFLFQAARRAYPFPHPLVCHFRRLAGKIELRKLGYAHGSRKRANIPFFILHNKISFI